MQRLLINTISNDNKEIISDKEALQHICDTSNSIKKTSYEIGLDCPKCNNKSHYMKIKEIKPNEFDIVCIKCDCDKKRYWIRKAMKNGFSNQLLLRSSDYKCENKKQKERKNIIIDFCKNHAEDTQWILFLGNSGSGKTMLATIIANHLLYNLNKNILYITWTDFIAKIKRHLLNQDIDSFENEFQEVKNVDVLFIDELIKNYTDADLRYVNEIINYRYNNDLKTIITCERLKNDLLKLDQSTYSRVIMKSKPFIIEVPYDIKENYRLKD